MTMPLLVAGSLTAHQVGYCVAARARCGEALAATGHDYLGHPQPLIAALIALAAVGMLIEAMARRRRGARALSAWPFALAAPLGYLIQEHLERAAHLGEVSPHLLIEPVVLAGLVLQVPFALLSWWAARALLRVAPRLLATLAGRRTRRLGGAPPRLPRPMVPRPVARLCLLATCSAGRAPPSQTASSPAALGI